MQINNGRLINACKAAIERFHRDHQIQMVIEECSELITAILHRGRGKATESMVAGEAADCLIMSLQALLMFTANDDEAEAMLLHKLQRLEERLGK